MPLNEVKIEGTLARDPRYFDTKAGTPLCNFTIIHNHYGKKKSFLECVAWKNTAKEVFEKCREGTNIKIIGSIMQNNYKDKTTDEWVNKGGMINVNSFEVIVTLEDENEEKEDNIPF